MKTFGNNGMFQILEPKRTDGTALKIMKKNKHGLKLQNPPATE